MSNHIPTKTIYQIKPAILTRMKNDKFKRALADFTTRSDKTIGDWIRDNSEQLTKLETLHFIAKHFGIENPLSITMPLQIPIHQTQRQGVEV